MGEQAMSTNPKIKSIIMLLTITSLYSISANANLDKKIATYEKSSKVTKTIKKLRRNVLGKSKGLCAKYVRLGFMASGLIPSHPGINYAKNYKPYFNKNGWTDLASAKKSKKWSSAIRKDLFKSPNGCAVVYEAINPANDRNGHIGHIETRVKDGSSKRWGFISDYYSSNPRTRLNCIRKGKKKNRVKVFTSRSTKKRVKRKIAVTECKKHSKSGAFVSDEWVNRRVISVHCKL
jgi:hypothetical protein